MANKPISMSKLRQILRLHTQGESNLQISKLSGISRNTLKKYVKKLRGLRLTYEDVNLMSDDELDTIFGSYIPEPCERYTQLHALFPKFEKELKRKGMTRQKLWEEYIKEYSTGYRITQFKEHYHKWVLRSKPIMHINHKAGDKMYIDFTGEKLQIVDPQTGEVQKTKVFISVLGASQLTYIEATISQKKEDFIAACENALHYYGGVPLAIVPDNLKSAVTKSDKYEPTLNEAFESFARHYSTAVLPARVYKPKDKSLVEGGVRIAYNRIYTYLYGKTFFSLAEINKAIREALEVHNNTHLTNRPYSRRQLFEDVEKETLHELPALRFEFKKQQIATVARNGRICLKEDKHYYTVPPQHLGKKVKVLYSQTQVEIYYRYVVIARHERDRLPYGHTENPDHIAPNHRYLIDWNPLNFINQAAEIADPVKELIVKILDTSQHPEQAYKSCMGVLSYEKKVGRERLVNACKRALEYEQYTYGTIKNILERGLDSIAVEENVPELTIPEHVNIRGEQYYS